MDEVRAALKAHIVPNHVRERIKRSICNRPKIGLADEHVARSSHCQFRLGCRAEALIGLDTPQDNLCG